MSDRATDDASRPTPPARVLIAEDNEFNAELVRELLRRRGHQSVTARNGREALEALEAGSFDLLLLDLHMPELDGFAVIARLRAREQLTGAHLPVVALTARARKHDRERCLAAGMDEFLAKPIQGELLWRLVERLLRREG